MLCYISDCETSSITEGIIWAPDVFSLACHTAKLMSKQWALVFTIFLSFREHNNWKAQVKINKSMKKAAEEKEYLVVFDKIYPVDRNMKY